MNPYPQDHSILILDNCQIHKTNALREIVEGHLVAMVFLPPYSPDFNPIEESFSCGEFSTSCGPFCTYFVVKFWICRHWAHLQMQDQPEVLLMEAAHTVTGEKACSWFQHSGYNI